jgi:pantothenate kinase
MARQLIFFPFSYEEFLELSQRGNNLSVDLTVGDIYGEEGYPKVLIHSLKS